MMISLGYLLIFGIVLVPVYVAILAAFIGKPRQPKFTAFIYGFDFSNDSHSNTGYLGAWKSPFTIHSTLA